jgi:hypothetical protein
LTDFDENALPRRLRFGVCFSIAIIGACPNENFVSRDLAISDYSDRLLARCFLRLANLPNYALDRLSRYEATLWRQAGQILFALDALDRRKPWDRRRRFRVGGRRELPVYDPEEC